MSGTSADGIDAALVTISGCGTRSRLRLLAFKTYKYPPKYKRFLLKNSDASTANLDDIARLHVLVGEFFADAVRNITRSAGLSMRDIDLIGSHGQTIRHLPNAKVMFGNHIQALSDYIGYGDIIRMGIQTVQHQDDPL